MLLVMEKQNLNCERCRHTPLRMVKVKGVGSGATENSCTQQVKANNTNTLENSLAISSKIKYTETVGSSHHRIPVLVIFPGAKETCKQASHKCAWQFCL